MPSRSRAPASLAALCKPSQGSRAALLLGQWRIVRSNSCSARKAALHPRRQRADVERRRRARQRAGGRLATAAAAVAPLAAMPAAVGAAVPAALPVAASTAAAPPLALPLTRRLGLAAAAPAAAAGGAGALVRRRRRHRNGRGSARPSGALTPTLSLRAVGVIAHALLPAGEEVTRFASSPHR
jgi:hypothetical protein